MHHQFINPSYINTFANHTPALRINPGDTVSTKTLDSRGHGPTKQEAPAGNPATGPFYIKGAAPGDTLKIKLKSIQPNRSHSYSSIGLAPSVLETYYKPSQDRFREDSTWQIKDNKAVLIDPQIDFTVHLKPMMGCIGVAPDLNREFSTRTSDRHGGNMDYNRITAGVTLYFPIFQPGALFALGDGHAAQGDGEILGRGLEVSMDVTFKADIIKNRAIRWPRGETNTDIFTIGNSRTLEQALKHATSEMVYWLKEYNLDEVTTHMLIGQYAKYDIANVFNPAYTIALRLNKKYLQNLT
ncbi:MAG: acetamidase [Firmicutes bacterium]|nr:acetamidase [Bacillota bacterium]